MKPILFNTEMVRAILDGRKTVTRRFVKQKPYCDYPRDCECTAWDHGKTSAACDGSCPGFQAGKPPYQPGDVLYVRETWGRVDIRRNSGYTSGRYVYKATDRYPFGEKYITKFRWHPSIHMPKEAARIFLKVTDVRLERLQDIDEYGVRNEGLLSMAVHCGDREIAQKEFSILWNSTVKKSDLGKYGWRANPWVFVIEFERCEKPE